VVHFRPRSILVAVGVVLAVAAAVVFLFAAQAGLTLIAISLFLALALNPAVEFFQARGMSRGSAVGAVYILALAFFALLGFVFVPPLVKQVGNFIDATPGLVRRPHPRARAAGLSGDQVPRGRARAQRHPRATTAAA